jgi:ribosomal protein S18 acetylase RimI-like enzyme
LRIGSVTDIAIRRASASDAAALAALGRDTFTETFGHLYPPKDLAGFLDAAHAPQHYTDVARDPGFALWIAEADGRAVAYAEAGRCLIRHADVTPDCGELQRLYVRRDAQGGGLGVRLLETALHWLERPDRRLWIGCWSENYGAQRLYARYGFEKVGEYEFSVGDSRDLEFILARPDPGSPPRR